MKKQFSITENERNHLRDLAQKYLEYASLPIMTEREERWYKHNSLNGTRPMFVMEIGRGVKNEILPPMVCKSEAAREIEESLLSGIVNHELIDDDKVLSPEYKVPWTIGFRLFDIEINRQHAEDSKGRNVGFRIEYPIKDLKADFRNPAPSVSWVNREDTMARRTFTEDVIGDILPVDIDNNSLRWFMTPSAKIIELMGMESLMIAMYDCPDRVHELYRSVTNDLLRYVKWQEDEELLTLNNRNDYTGAGSYGFTNELPLKKTNQSEKIRTSDLWVNVNSQESVGISPSMYGEFIFPYYCEIAEKFGLVYYGCCEAVHEIWGDYLSRLPHLRKVSISAWCDEQIMGEQLKGSNVIYSRKPSPNFIGVGNFDAEGYRASIEDTLEAAKGCQLEIINRDIVTINNDSKRLGQAVKIARECIDRLWA